MFVFRQDQQDFQDYIFLSHFPDGSEKTQSASGGNLPIYLQASSMIFLNIIPFTPRFYISKWMKLLDYRNYYVSLLHSLFYLSCML